jgi:hypothetical protein
MKHSMHRRLRAAAPGRSQARPAPLLEGGLDVTGERGAAIRRLMKHSMHRRLRAAAPGRSQARPAPPTYPASGVLP